MKNISQWSQWRWLLSIASLVVVIAVAENAAIHAGILSEPEPRQKTVLIKEVQTYYVSDYLRHEGLDVGVEMPLLMASSVKGSFVEAKGRGSYVFLFGSSSFTASGSPGLKR